MANIDDLVTVQKNGVVAVNALVQALSDFKTLYEKTAGTSVDSDITSNTRVFAGSGRLVSISIVTAATGGTIHDSATVVAADSTNTVYTIPNSTGIVGLGIPITNGLIIKPGVGSVITVIYSEDA